VTREEIVAALAAAEATAAALRRMLAEHDGAPERAPEPRLVDSKVAERISGKSRSWLYSNAKKYGLGFQTESGSWSFHEDRCRAFRNGQIVEREDCAGAAKSATARDSTPDANAA
jgi:hypothetical protein